MYAVHLLLKVKSTLLFFEFYPIYILDLSVDMSYVTLLFSQLNELFHTALSLSPEYTLVHFCSGSGNPDKLELIPHDVFQLTGLIDLISTLFTSDPPQPVITTSFWYLSFTFCSHVPLQQVIKSWLGRKNLITCFLKYAPCAAYSSGHGCVFLINKNMCFY